MNDSPLQRFESLVERARDRDGRAPFSDGALVEHARGERELVWLNDTAALATATEAEFVVDPDHRQSGQGRAMLELLLSTRQRLLVWAHGDHAGAKALAARKGLTRERTLLHLRGAVFESDIPLVTSFTDDDIDDWLELNARAFAYHPQQGAIGRQDLESLMTQPWFNRDDLLVMRERGRMVAYTWMKVDGALGEFYIVGVDPERQKSGLGRTMMEAGFGHLAAKGIRTAHLYVDPSNVAAVRLYRSMGFYDHAVDVQYSWVAS